jgi:hypothetical protein
MRMETLILRFRRNWDTEQSERYHTMRPTKKSKEVNSMFATKVDPYQNVRAIVKNLVANQNLTY